MVTSKKLYEQLSQRIICWLFLHGKERAMAKGKYEYWLTDEGLLLIEGWARDGLIEDQIAKNMGVSRSTLQKWKNDYQDISDALKKGKEVVDRQVENALFKKAIEGDTTAMIFWLKNRKPVEWRDRHETNLSGTINLAEQASVIDEYLNDG